MEPRPAPSGSTSTSPAVLDRTAGLEGVIYLTAGSSGADIDLYRVELDPVAITRVTDDLLVSTIDGCDSGLFVSAQVTLGDQLFRLSEDALRALPGLERAHASAPAVSFDCTRVAFSRPPFPDDPRHLVRVWDVKAARARETLAERRPLGHVFWGPGDALTLLRASGAARVVDKGSARPLDLPAGATTLKWSTRGPLAVSTDELDIFITSRRGGFERVARGWVVQDWAPDGTTLLVRRPRTPVLGVYRLGEEGVSMIARLDLQGIFQAEWLTGTT